MAEQKSVKVELADFTGECHSRGLSQLADVLLHRCGAQRVLVQFQYLFEKPEAVEIVVYLSDVPELLGHDDPLAANDNQLRDHLREIEVDRAGNVYLLNVHRRNESDILWKYRGDGTRLKRWGLMVQGRAINVPDPAALTVTADGQTMHLASGQRNGQDPNNAVIYGLSTETADFTLIRSIATEGMVLVASITEDPATPERIAEWLRMSLQARQDGKCDGVVTPTASTSGRRAGHFLRPRAFCRSPVLARPFGRSQTYATRRSRTQHARLSGAYGRGWE